jgi:hypothetical protein
MVVVMRARQATAAALVAAVCIAAAGCGGSNDNSKTTATTATKTSTTAPAVQLGPPLPGIEKLPGAVSTTPPWTAGDDLLEQRLRKIGLPILQAEGQVVHIHQHLDVIAEGKPVPVPANIGIGAGGTFITSLHTHDATGVMHVESPTAESFSLGQFFAVWGVKLNRDCIGGLCAGGGKVLRTWVNGSRVEADPTRIVLAEHQEIVIAYGTPAQMPKPVPSSYDFGPGL